MAGNYLRYSRSVGQRAFGEAEGADEPATCSHQGNRHEHARPFVVSSRSHRDKAPIGCSSHGEKPQVSSRGLLPRGRTALAAMSGEQEIRINQSSISALSAGAERALGTRGRRAGISSLGPDESSPRLNSPLLLNGATSLGPLAFCPTRRRYTPRYTERRNPWGEGPRPFPRGE